MAEVRPVAINPKRGFVADGGANASCDDPLLLSTSGWYYDYNVQDPYARAGLIGDCAAAAKKDQQGRFTPMNWCLSSMHAAIPTYATRATHFMGFNEPNNKHNCNTDAEAVAKAWSTVMQRWPNHSLVSPATAGDGIQWYDEFFGNCTKLYGGTNGCRISHLATHDYSCTANHTLDYLRTLHERYGFPVWLTEFSCGDHAQGRPMSAHAAFMREVLPLLDAAPFVARYSWMSARDGSGKRGLVETVETAVAAAAGEEEHEEEQKEEQKEQQQQQGDASSHETKKARLTELGEIWNAGGGSEYM